MKFNRERYNERVEMDLLYNGTADSKKAKRIGRLNSYSLSPIVEAHDRGSDHAYCGRPYRNCYPKGRRHKAYHEGYMTADPMGAHHGRNE